jgi:hypothetical protein
MNEEHLVLTLQNEVRNLRAKLEVANNKLRQNKIINRGKTYNDLHKRQRIYVINKIKKRQIDLNKEMKNFLIKIDHIVLKEIDNNINDNTGCDVFFDSSEYDEKSVNDYIFLKDKANISNDKWNFLRSFLSNSEIPSNYMIKKNKKKLNSQVEIFVLSNNEGIYGAYINQNNRIKYLIESLNNLNPELFTENINIKFTCDGFSMCKLVSNLNVAFSIINEGSKAMTSKGIFFYKIKFNIILILKLSF